MTDEIQDYKLKISSKRLKSGKCQIKFEFVQANVSSFYGYILAEGKTPLREVVTTIYERTKSFSVGDYFHDHLFHIQKRNFPQHHIFLFKN